MATFANLAGLDLPTEDRDGQPTIFDSCDQTALLTGTGPSTRDHWFYMTETELIPGAVRLGKWKAIWNIRDGLEGRGPIHQHRAGAVRPLAGPRRALRHLHDGLGGEDLAGPADGRQGPQPAADLRQYPNRPLQTAGISGAVFEAEDAQVQQQVQR